MKQLKVSLGVFLLIVFCACLSPLGAQVGQVTRRLIGQQDIFFWDGVIGSFNYVDPNGNLLTLSKVGNEVDVCAVYGGGLYTTQTALQSAITAVGTTNKMTFILRPGTWPITSSLVIPANINIKPMAGAIFAISTTKTLTINGTLDAGLYQIFSCTGTGKVTFGSGAVKECYPEWWAVNTAPGTTDMTTAMNAAFASGAPALCLTQTYWVGNVTIPAAIDVYGPGKLLGDGTDLISAVGTVAAGVAYGSAIAIGESSFVVANSFAAGDVLLLSNNPAGAINRRKELLIVATATAAGFTTTTEVLQTYASTTSLQFQKMTPIDSIHFFSPNWENHNFSFSMCRGLVIQNGKAIECAVETKTCLQYSIDFIDFDAKDTGRFLDLYEMNRNFSVTGNFTGGLGASDNGLVKVLGGSDYLININVNGTTNGGGYLHGLMIDTYYASNPTGYDYMTNCYFTAIVNCRGVYGYAIQMTANATPTDIWIHDFHVGGQWADAASINLVYAKNGVISGHGKGGVLSLSNTADIVVTNDNFLTHTFAGTNTNLQGIWQDFTPVVSGTTGTAPEPAMHANAVGRYIKRGRTVDFRASYIWTDAGSRTGNLVLNAPVTMTGGGAGSQNSPVSVGAYVGVTTHTNGLVGLINWGTATVSLYYDGATAVPLEATGTIYLSGTYETAN